MPAFLVPLFTKLFWGSLWSKAKTNAVHDWQAIPPKVRLWILGIIAAGILIFAHQLYAHHQLKAQYKAGYDQAVADIKAASAKKTVQISTNKTVGDAKAVAITEGVENAEAIKAHDTVAAFAALRLRGAGAQHWGLTVPQPSVHDVSSGAGVPATAEPDGRPVDGGLPVEVHGATITLPLDATLDHGQTCDLDHLELAGWRSWYSQQHQNYLDWVAKSNAIR